MTKLGIGDKPTKRLVFVRVPHGVNPRMVISVYPGGEIGLREHRRRKEYRLEVGTLYVAAIMAELRERRREKRRRRS